MQKMIQKGLRGLAVAVVIAVIGVGAASAAETLTGAGATFPYPIYSKWFDEYNKVNPKVQINYQSIGSGGGIRQITSRTVDFGATDGPMTDKALFDVDGVLVHIPTVLGAVVPVYNVAGVDKLDFTGDLLADIFLGKIKKWNDSRIAAVNPKAKLPDAPIVVVHRSDGSGTTYVWVDYLSTVSKEWATKVGTGTSVNWPVGLGGKGNEGVAGLVKNVKNSIGYVELIYAKQNDIDYGAVRNRAGRFVKATTAGVSAAAAGAAATMPKDYRVSIVNAPGAESYPISSFTWLLVYKNNPGDTGKILKGFLRWMVNQGQQHADDLGYAPLPGEVKTMVAKTIETIQ